MQWLLFVFAVEQVKGLPELRQKIISAAKEARKSKDYPIELQNHDCLYISDKYAEHTNRVLPQPHGPYPHLDRKSHNFLYNYDYGFFNAARYCRTFQRVLIS